MLPAPAQLYACPHSGKKKAMLSLMSSNTFGGTLWSDGRSIYPMSPEISPIQRCESCGSYSLFSEWKNCGCDNDNYNGTTGDLTYEESREAYIQLMDPELYNEQDLLVVCLEYIRSYNDQNKRKVESPKDSDDFIHFMNATESALNLLDIDSDSLVTIAELQRERCEFDEARESLLKAINEKNEWIVGPMLYHCYLSDSSPFLLVENGHKVEWSKSPNYDSIVGGALQRKKEMQAQVASSTINTVNEVNRENIVIDGAGGVYNISDRTLLKISEDCSPYYKMKRGTQNIAESAAYQNNNLESIDFPHSLRSICARAFCGCKNLAGYSYDAFGMNITSIGSEAFMNCKKLDGFSALFLANVRFIGRGAFSGMDSLKVIGLPEGLTEIPDYCFACNQSLASMKIPSTVKAIGEGAFFCSCLTEMNFPDSVERLGEGIFSACKDLKRVRMPKSLKVIPERIFSLCKSLGELVIPSKVKSIKRLAFQSTKSLKKVRFKGKVERIDPDAFKDSSCEVIEVPWYLKGYYERMLPKMTVKARVI